MTLSDLEPVVITPRFARQHQNHRVLETTPALIAKRTGAQPQCRSQRPERRNFACGPKSQKIRRWRPDDCGLTRGNVSGFHIRGSAVAETALAGWRIRIETQRESPPKALGCASHEDAGPAMPVGPAATHIDLEAEEFAARWKARSLQSYSRLFAPNILGGPRRRGARRRTRARVRGGSLGRDDGAFCVTLCVLHGWQYGTRHPTNRCFSSNRNQRSPK
jgi:hypothetical protein